MKRTILLVSLLGLLISGCSSIVKKPDFYSVKKLAIVSVYANHKIYDVDGKMGQSGVDLRALKALVGKEDPIEADEIMQITTAGLDLYINELKKMNQWVIADPKTVLNHPAYKALQQSNFFNAISGVTPALNMKLIAFNEVADSTSKQWKNGKEVHEEARKSLAQLCKELNVNGVAIVELDLGFKTVFLSGMKGSGLFAGVKAPAKPSASSAMIIITKDGKIAAQTKGIQKGGGARFEGDKVTMLHQGRVTLASKDGAPVREYTKVVRMTAEDLRTKIEKELAAK